MKFPIVVKKGSVSVKIYRVQRPARESRAEETLYTLAWYAGDKRRTQQYADLQKAKDEAQLKVEQLAAGRIESAASLGLDDARTLKEARRIAGEVPLISALEEWAKARELSGGAIIQAAEAWAARQGTAYERITVGDSVDAFIKAKERAQVNTGKTYRPLLILKEAMGGHMLDTISTLALSRWMHKRFGHPSYFNTALKRYRTLWKWSRKNGYLPRDTQTAADNVDAMKEQKGRIGIITTAQLRKALGIIQREHSHYIAPLVLACFAGLRSSEVHGQVWEDVLLEGKTKHVRVTEAKPNTPAYRLVPLCPAAVEWLMKCPDRKGPVCTNLAIERIRDILITAKVDLPENAFRHSYISHACAATGDVSRVALNAGNSYQKIHSNYRQLVTEAEGKAWFKIGPQSLRIADIERITKLNVEVANTGAA